jgi:hypothetical protein
MTDRSATFNVHIRRMLLDRPERLDPSLAGSEIAESLAQALAATSSASKLPPGASPGATIAKAIAARLEALGVCLERETGLQIANPTWMKGTDHGQ